jgi:phosphoglycerate dehydrogenase-like enzyme
MTARPRALLSMGPELPEMLFDAAARERLASSYDVDFDDPVADLGALDDAVLAVVDTLLTGWGATRVDAALLARIPRLRAIHHAAGSVRGIVGDACWDRSVRVTSAAEVNARPVAEYAVAMIVLAAKQVFRGQELYRRRRTRLDHLGEFRHAGTNGAVVGLVGASRIGRRVIELLRPYDLEILLHDPFVGAEEAAALGVTPVGLGELFERSAVVSLHAPLLPSTAGMIDSDLLARLPDGATLVNTARGGLVDLVALTEELATGRIHAVLDTTDPLEPLPEDSLLYGLPNVVLTPHLAGALGNELTRLGDHAVDQALRLQRGEPLDGEVTRESIALMA